MANDSYFRFDYDEEEDVDDDFDDDDHDDDQNQDQDQDDGDNDDDDDSDWSSQAKWVCWKHAALYFAWQIFERIDLTLDTLDRTYLTIIQWSLRISPSAPFISLSL